MDAKIYFNVRSAMQKPRGGWLVVAVVYFFLNKLIKTFFELTTCSFMFKRIVKGDMNTDIEQGRKTGRNSAKKIGND